MCTKGQISFGDNNSGRRPSSDFSGNNNNGGNQRRPSSDSFGNSASNQNFKSDNVNIGSILGLEKPSVNKKFNVNKRAGQSCTDPRGIQGSCNYIFASECSNVLRAIRQLGLTQEVITFLLGAIKSPCGFELFDYTLCCVGTGT